MNSSQIFRILKQVFFEFDVEIHSESPWYKIRIDDYTKVYTYGRNPDKEDNIWYFSTYYDGNSKEVMIPSKDTFEFVQVFKDIYIDIIKAKEILKSLDIRINSIDSTENIRDKKINNIVDYDSKN